MLTCRITGRIILDRNKVLTLHYKNQNSSLHLEVFTVNLVPCMAILMSLADLLLDSCLSILAVDASFTGAEFFNG